MIFTTRSYPRAALIGNPSDGYNGKTIAFVFNNFFAEVVLYESPELEILASERDHSLFSSVKGLVDDVTLYGYYGGIRLLKAAIKIFSDYCDKNAIEIPEQNFTIRYHSTIPHRLGLAGSSAIITACMRALMQFYGVSIPKPVLANLVLSVERVELLISAGLQDRVAQSYGGCVYMDFSKEIMDRQGFGHYESIDPKLLPSLYIAYRTDLSEGSEVLHNDLRARYTRGDTDVHDAIREWASLAEQVKSLLVQGCSDKIGPILDRNFDIRKSVCTISRNNIAMVEAARSVGASAKFTGSGGAIIGTYYGEGMFQKLQQTLEKQGIVVIKPQIHEHSEIGKPE